MKKGVRNRIMNHSFNTEIAKLYGIEEAILLENIYFWCKREKSNKKIINGKPWTYNSVKAFNEIFDYMTPSKISRALKNLEEKGLIETGCFNKNTYDRTKWYCVTEKAIAFFESEKSILQNEKSNCQNNESISQKEEMNLTNINTDVNTNIHTDIYTSASKTFEKPTVEEIAEYCKLRNNAIDPQHFFDFYESKGWLVGKSRMKDWKACVRTWERNGVNRIQKKKPRTEGISAAEYKEGMSDLEHTPF